MITVQEKFEKFITEKLPNSDLSKDSFGSYEDQYVYLLWIFYKDGFNEGYQKGVTKLHF